MFPARTRTSTTSTVSSRLDVEHGVVVVTSSRDRLPAGTRFRILPLDLIFEPREGRPPTEAERKGVRDPYGTPWPQQGNGRERRFG
jgi:hypothetical protein